MIGHHSFVPRIDYYGQTFCAHCGSSESVCKLRQETGLPFVPAARPSTSYVHHTSIAESYYEGGLNGTTTDDWARVTCPSCLREKPSTPHDFRDDDNGDHYCVNCGSYTNTPTCEPRKDTPTMTIPFTMTQDTITVVLDGKVYTVAAGTPQYHGLRDCIFREDWTAISRHVSLTGALQQWLGDKFVVDGQAISYEGAALPESIAQRIWTMAAAGESPGPLFAFYERLAKNPSYRSVQQLWGFLAHMGIPLEPDGTFLAYKGVREDFTDGHTGTINNEPGQVHKMPRNQISDDPSKTCHYGFHVGAAGYAGTFSARTVIVRVDPENVVCVPNDYSAQKMRVCEYTVVGNWAGEVENDVAVGTMPSTTVKPGEIEVDDEGDEDEWGGDVEYQDENPNVMAEAQPEPVWSSAAPAHVITTNKPTAPKAAAFARKNPRQLMEESIDDLRKYASGHLKIVGASKMPGGKAKLVSAILKARRKRSRR